MNMGDKMAQYDLWRRNAPTGAPYFGRMYDAAPPRMAIVNNELGKLNETLEAHVDSEGIVQAGPSWESDARRYAQNADYWRARSNSLHVSLASVREDKRVLVDERDEARGEVKVRDRTITDLREALTRVKEQRDQAWEQGHGLRHDLAEAEKERDGYASELKRAEATADGLNARCDRMRQALSKVQEELGKQRGEIERQQARLDAFRFNASCIREERDELAKDLHTSREEIDRLREELRQQIGILGAAPEPPPFAWAEEPGTSIVVEWHETETYPEALDIANDQALLDPEARFWTTCKFPYTARRFQLFVGRWHSKEEPSMGFCELAYDEWLTKQQGHPLDPNMVDHGGEA